MADAIPIRTDFNGKSLRHIAKNSQDAKQVRRLLTLAVIYDGAPRSEAAQIGGVGPQVLRDWIMRFNAHGPEGLIDRKAPGKAPMLEDKHRHVLAHVVENEPNPYVEGAKPWRLKDLVLLFRDRFGVTVSETTIGRELHGMGFHKVLPEHGEFDPASGNADESSGCDGWIRSQPKMRSFRRRSTTRITSS